MNYSNIIDFAVRSKNQKLRDKALDWILYGSQALINVTTFDCVPFLRELTDEEERELQKIIDEIDKEIECLYNK